MSLVWYVAGEQNKEDHWTEVQKKITPWRLGIQEQEAELQLVAQQRVARLGKLHGALLVVASLIDKPTNLGGQEKPSKLQYLTSLYNRIDPCLIFSLVMMSNITTVKDNPSSPLITILTVCPAFTTDFLCFLFSASTFIF